MKIYVAHSTGFDFNKESYLPIKESDLFAQYEFVFPHEKSTEPFDSKEFIKTCDLILAEVSHPSTGMGIELGWADASNIPVLCVYKTGAHISASLKTITNRFFEYSSEKDFVEKLSATLKTF